MAMAFTFIGSTAIATNTFETKITVNNSYSWELVKEENGIKVYFSQYESTLGTLSLKIKFENTTNQPVNLSWSLTNDAKTTTRKNSSSSVEANKSIEFMDEETPISINIGETINDFHINFNVQ